MLHRISRDEVANTITHAAGILLSLAGMLVLGIRSIQAGGVAEIVAAWVYGLSTVSVFTASTLYHAATSRRLKQAFLWLDHSCIYALIAGTYTPFMVGVLRGATGHLLLGVIWALAAVGVLAKTVLRVRSELISLPFYLAIGWLILLVMREFAGLIAPQGLLLLAAGGVCFTAGLVFYFLRWTYAHATWHVFVLAGAALHYTSVLYYSRIA